jgi:hypothetical protein
MRLRSFAGAKAKRRFPPCLRIILI